MKYLLSFLLAALVFCGCDDNKNDDFSGFATAEINGTIFESNLPEFKQKTVNGENNQPDIEVTQLVMQGRDGTTMTVTFPGRTTGSFNLTGTNAQTATYLSETGNEFVAFSGIVVVDKYETVNNQTTIAGSFEFQAQSILDQSFIGITNGNFNISKTN